MAISFLKGNLFFFARLFVQGFKKIIYGTLAIFKMIENNFSHKLKLAHLLTKSKDIQARARILARIERLAAGNAGDVKPVGKGVSELRINFGPGYRVYFTKRGRKTVILLAGPIE